MVIADLTDDLAPDEPGIGGPAPSSQSRHTPFARSQQQQHPPPPPQLSVDTAALPRDYNVSDNAANGPRPPAVAHGAAQPGAASAPQPSAASRGGETTTVTTNDASPPANKLNNIFDQQQQRGSARSSLRRGVSPGVAATAAASAAGRSTSLPPPVTAFLGGAAIGYSSPSTPVHEQQQPQYLAGGDSRSATGDLGTVTTADGTDAGLLSNAAGPADPEKRSLGGTNNNPSSSSPPTAGPSSGGGGAATPALFNKKLLEPKKPIGREPTWRVSLLNIARYSWLNALLVFLPISWAMHFSHQTDTVVFCTAFAAIVPLAALLGFATEELAIRVGDTFGGLLNATFGNAVELIVAILALVKGELGVVQSAMIGSILSNCLLVLGMCFFAGGLRFHEQGYGVRAAQLNISLLGISVVAISLPAGFWATADLSSQASIDATDESLLKLSHGFAIILLVVYASYLMFQLWTHAYLYMPPPRQEGQPIPPRPKLPPPAIGPQPPTETAVFRLPSWGSSTTSSASSRSSISSVSDAASSIHHTHSREDELDVEQGFPPAAPMAEALEADQDDDKHLPKLSALAASCLIVVITILTGVTAEWLVDSIDGLTTENNISEQFVALILLPLVGNAAEHVTAVVCATKNKLDLSLAVAVGSSIQIALFVIPFLVILGWAIGQPLTFYFDLYETIILFLSIVVVNWAIQDDRSNWLEGFILMVLYVLIALVIWFYPGSAENLTAVELS